MTEDLGRALDEGRVTVAVIGQGYVGLSLACGAANAGLDVVGIDIDPERVRALDQGRLVVPGVKESAFALAAASGRMSFTTSEEAMATADVVVVAVPTPVVDHRPELSAIEAAVEAVGRQRFEDETLLVLESTTYAGTTEEIVIPRLEEAGHRVGEDLQVAYSPERIDPGNLKYDLRTTPRIVGGHTPRAAELAATFYGHMVDEVHVLSSTRAAEMAKLLENTYRMVNIALVNELATICGEQDLDVWEVIRGAATKPFGFMAFEPGPGVGGHCIPLDPEYLAWQSRRATGRRFQLVELAQDVNHTMPRYVADRIAGALNDRRGLAVRDAGILALGVTYKPDVGDLRESAAVEVLRHLVRRGAVVSFHDPYVDHLELERTRLESRPGLDARDLAGADLVALLTPHSEFDLERVVDHARLVFDARNALGEPGARPDNVVVL